MKTAAILQSSYIPWKGYFDIINDVDEFIFLDDVQYTKSDWRSRNKLITTLGVQWITIPVGSNTNRLICDVEIKDSSWQLKHYKTIVTNYSNAPFFSRYKSFIENIYLDNVWHNLSALNQSLIKRISYELGIKTSFKDSRNYEVTSNKNARILDLLIKSGTNRYISGPAAKDYIDPISMESSSIELVWKDYQGYPEYPQRHKNFEHNVSILDLLFNTGTDAPYFIWGWREQK
jgi:hypothetical protein